MSTRKEVKTILEKHGMTSRFSLRTVSYSDLLRETVQVIEFKDNKNGLMIPKEAESELRKMRIFISQGVYFG